MPERDENGRFTKGKSGNPAGRPKGSYRPPMDVSGAVGWLADLNVGEEDWTAILLVAVDNARRGDAAARKFLFEVRKQARATEHFEKPGSDVEKLERLIEGRIRTEVDRRLGLVPAASPDEIDLGEVIAELENAPDAFVAGSGGRCCPTCGERCFHRYDGWVCGACAIVMKESELAECEEERPPL